MDTASYETPPGATSPRRRAHFCAFRVLTGNPDPESAPSAQRIASISASRTTSSQLTIAWSRPVHCTIVAISVRSETSDFLIYVVLFLLFLVLVFCTWFCFLFLFFLLLISLLHFFLFPCPTTTPLLPNPPHNAVGCGGLGSERSEGVAVGQGKRAPTYSFGYSLSTNTQTNTQTNSQPQEPLSRSGDSDARFVE